MPAGRPSDAPVAEGAEALSFARERFALSDYRGAVLLLEELARTGTAYADAHNLLGLSLAMIDRHDDALASFDRALALNPRYVEAHLNRSVLLSSMGRGDEAARGVAHARALGRPDDTGFPSVVGDRLANLHADLGHAYRDAGAPDEAIAQYERALQLRPAYPDVRLALARALLEHGRYAEAERALGVALAARPGWLDAVLLRGLSAYLQGELDRADAEWSQAARQNEHEPRIALYRAMLAQRRAER